MRELIYLYLSGLKITTIKEKSYLESCMMERDILNMYVYEDVCMYICERGLIASHEPEVCTEMIPQTHREMAHSETYTNERV